MHNISHSLFQNIITSPHVKQIGSAHLPHRQNARKICPTRNLFNNINKMCAKLRSQAAVLLQWVSCVSYLVAVCV